MKSSYSCTLVLKSVFPKHLNRDSTKKETHSIMSPKKVSHLNEFKKKKKLSIETKTIKLFSAFERKKKKARDAFQREDN